MDRSSSALSGGGLYVRGEVSRCDAVNIKAQPTPKVVEGVEINGISSLEAATGSSSNRIPAYESGLGFVERTQLAKFLVPVLRIIFRCGCDINTSLTMHTSRARGKMLDWFVHRCFRPTLRWSANRRWGAPLGKHAAAVKCRQLFWELAS